MKKQMKVLSVVFAILLLVTMFPVSAKAASFNNVRLQRLASYINNYGIPDSNGKGMMLIEVETSEYYDFYYVLRNQSDGLYFDLLVTSDQSSRIVSNTEFVLTETSNYIYVDFIILWYYNNQCLDGVSTSKSINKTTMKRNSTYSVSGSGAYFTQSQVTNDFNETLKLLCSFWDLYIYDHLGFGLNAIGFTSYDGCGEVVCTSHSYDNSCDTTCNNCGATRTITHSYSGSCDRVCNICGYTRTTGGSHTYNNNSAIVTKKPTCVDTGIKTNSCKICGETTTEILAPTGMHTYVEGIYVDEYTHSATCTVCFETHTIEHSWDEGVVTTPSTCKETGVREFSCTICTATKTEVEPVLDEHPYDPWVKADNGTHIHTCPTCGKEETAEHKWKSGKCTVCGYKPAGAKITTQPTNVAVANGKTAKVTVKATGSGLKYTWYYAKKGSSKYTKVSGSSSSYSVKMSSSVDGRKVYCVVTDKYGNSVKSNVVTLYKGAPAKITTQPKSVTVVGGKTGSITLKASGSSLKYTWYIKYKGADSFAKVGKSSKTYSFKMASKLDGAQVYCVVKDKYGIEVKSSVVTIKMAAKPKVTTQPKSVLQVSGKTVKFTIKASGDGLKYQWYYAKKGSSSFKKLSGKTSATYSVKVSSSINGQKYYCLVTDKYGQTVKSDVVTLTMKTVAKITTQPKSVTAKNGATAKVTVKATGDGLTYTWYYLKSGDEKYTKASATSATFSVKMAAAWKNAKVYCVIADKYGNTVKSSVATLKMK